MPDILVHQRAHGLLRKMIGSGGLGAKLGKLVLNGPILAEHDIAGVSVYACGLEEARALAEADPKVVAGYLTVEAIPWLAVPSVGVALP